MSRRRRRLRLADAIELKTIEVNGETIKITLASDYTFYGYIYGDRIESPSLKGLEAAIKTAAKRDIVVAIEGTLIQSWSDGFTDVLITGRHNGNGNILYREDKAGAKTEQLHDEDRVCYRLNEAERAEYRKLCAAKRRAEKAVEAWPKSRRMNIKLAIRSAVVAQRPIPTKAEK